MNGKFVATQATVTCMIFAGFGDVAVFVAMAMQQEKIAMIAIVASCLLAFIGFRNVDQYYVKANTAKVWSKSDFWFAQGMMHMIIMSTIIGLYGLTTLWSDIPMKLQNNIVMLFGGIVYALLVAIVVWKLGFLDGHRIDRCRACGTPVGKKASFCQECGVRIFRCKQCGRLHKCTANYCEQCGVRLEVRYD